MKRKYKLDPDYRMPPGITLLETISERGMSRDELAEEIGMSKAEVDSLILGDAALTPEIADKLASVTQIPAGFWNRAEATYRRPN
jgi:plasmid maintenance system antidote protein VapI